MQQGIAMIELIFAIVIMGIVLMSAPMLISTATKSGYIALQQEGINEAASQINMILGYTWDESNTDDSHVITVLQTAGDPGLDENVTTGRRAGTPNISERTFIDDNSTKWSASAIGADGGDLDDMDDFNGTTVNLTEVQDADTGDAATTADYVEKKVDISISRTVGYISDGVGAGTYLSPGTGTDKKITFTPDFGSTPGGTTNIKRVSVMLTSNSSASELNTKSITLHAFSCNIGSYKLEER